MRKSLAIAIAEQLIKAKEGEPSHLWLCQIIAFELKKYGALKDAKKFSRKCGYNFNITL